MSNEERARPEPGQEPETDGPDGPAVVDPDDVVLDDGVISAEALEPELTVSAETLDLPEPALEPAQISSDTAEAASLEAAAAEARAVAAEAEKAGTLVGGPMPADAPVVDAAPAGTAPAGGTAGDTDGGATKDDDAQDRTAGDDAGDGSTVVSSTVVGSADDLVDESPGDTTDDTGTGTGGPAIHQAAETDAASPVGGPYAFPPEGGEPGLGHPGPYPGTDPGAVGSTASSPTDSDDPDGPPVAARAWVPTDSGGGQEAEGHPRRDRTRTRSSNLPILLVIGGVLVLLALLIWLLLSLFGGSDDEDRVDPSSVSSGECLADFTVITEDAVLVDCAEPHNAQLVASESYPEDAGFPGRDQLGLRAEASCAAASADINPDVVTEDLEVTLLRATPTEGTWADGDRRVDCFAVVENGDTLNQSLLNP
ncbi:hypothetical protein GM708_13075 [Vibrio cholerae]|nr:hypothetical protein [Vibrio cholerae]